MPYCNEYVEYIHIYNQEIHCTNCTADITKEVTDNMARQSKVIKIITFILGIVAIWFGIFLLYR